MAMAEQTEMLSAVAQANPQSMTRHAICGLGLWQFRHAQQMHLQPEGRSVLLSGANGVGKTNILEAVSLLSPGRGVRQASTEQFLHHGASPQRGWKIEATLNNGYTVASHWQAGTTSRTTSREVSIEGEKISQLALGHYCRCLGLGPRDDQIFLQGDESLRRFMDRLIAVFDPAHIARVQSLRQLQKQWRDLLETPKVDPLWSQALEKQLAAKMVVVGAARRQHALSLLKGLRQLPEFLARHLTQAGTSPHWSIGLEGEINTQLEQHPARVVEDHIAALLSAQRHPHTLVKLADRWQFHLRQTPQTTIAVDSLSNGQQKIALLAVVLAQTMIMQQELGITPILLLDEGISQLDHYHASMLFDHLHQLGCQFWISGVHVSAYDNHDNILLVDVTQYPAKASNLPMSSLTPTPHQ